MKYTYNPKSECAHEFINHKEIEATLEYAQKNKDNLALCREILDKARAHTRVGAEISSAHTRVGTDAIRAHTRVGKIDHPATLTHREAAVLLACTDVQINSEIFALAREIKQAYYGNRIVLFAPLYLSNYCVNTCAYCPYHAQNKTIPRKKLSQSEIREETLALIAQGHKRLAIEAGEDPRQNPLEYILESIETIYSAGDAYTVRNAGDAIGSQVAQATRATGGSQVAHFAPDTPATNPAPACNSVSAIRRINVNIAATTPDSYAQLKRANIGTYILFQETYNARAYTRLHPTGPKSDYCYHTEAHDRAMSAGIDDVGLGVLFGLDTYAYELCGLIMHAEHLEAVFGTGPHTISVPRVKPADGINPEKFDGSETNNGLTDEIFEKIIALIRLTVPYTGIIISTREGASVRARALDCGVSQISGGSRTSVGGYAQGVPNESATSQPSTNKCSSTTEAFESATLSPATGAQKRAPENPQTTEQFQVSDTRTLDEVISWLLGTSHIPSFCTSCYANGRTGDRFMQFCKSGQIQNFCHPNALLTLAEYAANFATPKTQTRALDALDREITRIQDPKTRSRTQAEIDRILTGQPCQFYF